MRTLSVGDVSASTTTVGDAVERHTATLLDLIRSAWARVRRPQTMLLKDVLRGRLKSVRHVCELVIDFAQAPETTMEEAESIGLALAAIARSEHAATHGTPAVLSVAEAHMLEEQKEGACDEAEARMTHYPSVSSWLAYLSASAELNRARRILDASVRNQVVRS